MGWLDQKLEKLFKKKLHKKRNYYIQKAIDEYIEKHHPAPEVITKLRLKLELEADRVYAIVDQSIIRERIKRAKWTFWISAIASIVIVGVLGAFSGGTALPFIIPVCAAFVTWLITLGTIPISYNTRIQGAMDSTLVAFEKEQNIIKEAAQQDFNPALYQKEIDGFKNSLVELIKNFNTAIPNQKLALSNEKLNVFANETSKTSENVPVNETSLADEMQDLKSSIQLLTAQVTALNEKIDTLNGRPEATPAKEVNLLNDNAFQEVLQSAFRIYSEENKTKSPKKDQHRFHFWHRNKHKNQASQEDENLGFSRTATN